MVLSWTHEGRAHQKTKICIVRDRKSLINMVWIMLINPYAAFGKIIIEMAFLIPYGAGTQGNSSLEHAGEGGFRKLVLYAPAS